MERRRAAEAVVAMIAAGCVGGCAAAAAPAPPESVVLPSVRVVYSAARYDLYTHCGIHEANIGGRWFVAADPAWDGAVNPPHDWGNPIQHGTIGFISDTEAVFTDDLGHRVVFVLRPGATGPLALCS